MGTPYTDVAQLADAPDLRSASLWVQIPPSVPPMLRVAQLAERRVVATEVGGPSPLTHPIWDLSSVGRATGWSPVRPWFDPRRSFQIISRYQWNLIPRYLSNCVSYEPTVIPWDLLEGFLSSDVVGIGRFRILSTEYSADPAQIAVGNTGESVLDICSAFLWSGIHRLRCDTHSLSPGFRFWIDQINYRTKGALYSALISRSSFRPSI